MTQTSPIPLRVDHLSVGYRGETALEDATFSARAGRVLGIVGPNGAGKSTLLRAALGLIPHDEGQVEFFGAPLRHARQRVGYMPQAKQLDFDFPMNVTDLVRMGTFGHHRPWQRLRPEQHQHVASALQLTGIESLALRQIGELSGGQRQRALLARTIAGNPDLILLDEPFAGVDMQSESVIFDALRKLCEQGATVILVHHDLTSVRQHCHDVLLLNKRVIAFGSIATTLTRRNLEATYRHTILPYGTC